MASILQALCFVKSVGLDVLSDAPGPERIPSDVRGSYFNIFLYLFVSAHVELKYAYFAQKTAKDTISSWLSLDFLFLFVVNQFLF